jgi:DNA-binding response OmpR family regulator
LEQNRPEASGAHEKGPASLIEHAVHRSAGAASRILVVEEDVGLRQSLRGRLEAEGFKVVTATDGEEALRAVGLDMPDAIILDLVLPELDGLSVWRRLREEPETSRLPILILSGEGEHVDRVLSLDLNADDFMTKPYNSQELVTRLKTLLRRSALSPPGRTIRAGAIEIDLDRYLVKVGDDEVRFTAKEFELLRTLLEARGRVLRRRFLLETIWGYKRSSEVESRTIDVHIGRLREKLGPAGACIITVRNVGYRIDTVLALLSQPGGNAEHA